MPVDLNELEFIPTSGTIVAPQPQSMDSFSVTPGVSPSSSPLPLPDADNFTPIPGIAPGYGEPTFTPPFSASPESGNNFRGSTNPSISPSASIPGPRRSENKNDCGTDNGGSYNGRCCNDTPVEKYIKQFIEKPIYGIPTWVTDSATPGVIAIDETPDNPRYIWVRKLVTALRSAGGGGPTLLITDGLFIPVIALNSQPLVSSCEPFVVDLDYLVVGAQTRFFSNSDGFSLMYQWIK